MSSPDVNAVRELVRALLSMPPPTRAQRLSELEATDPELVLQARAMLSQHEEPTRAPESQLVRPASGRPIRVGTYAIEGVLGEGGMGVVYRARQDRPRRAVALKLMRPGLLTPRGLRRFEHESEVLGRLLHPGIAQIYESGTADTGQGPQPFFAMELVDGESLTSYASRHELSVDDRVRLMIRVAGAVAHAHQKGVIHRDLKPANILVTDEGQPKILDFGVARDDARDPGATLETKAGHIVGTVPYMSPEQISGDPAAVDTRSDVYALGVMLYQLLAGRLPLQVENKTIVEAARVIETIEAPRLGSVDRALGGDLETICGKALEKDKTRRYQSASDFAADLERCLNDEPILARPPSRVYRARKFVRRNRALVVGTGFGVVMLLGGVAATAWQAVEATRGRGLAEQRGAEAQAAQTRAQTEAANAEAVNQFLVEMLLSASPEVEADAELTVREVVDRASSRLEVAQRAGEQVPPVVELRIRETLAKTYRALGRSDLAAPHAQRNVELADQVFGMSRHEPYSARNMLSLVKQDAGQLEEAEALAREAAEGLKRFSEPGDLDTAKAIGQLGQITMVNSKLDEAAELLAESLRLIESHPKATMQDRIIAMENLASLHERRGEMAKAEELLRQTAASRESAHGPDSVMLAFSLNNLANILQRRGKLEEALEIGGRALEIRRARLEPDHPSVLNSMNNVAVVLLSLKRHEEAIPLMEQVVAGYLRTLGEAHPTTLAAMNNLGYAYQDVQRLDDAGRVYLAALDARRRGGLLGSQDAWMLMNNAATLLVDLGRAEEADAIYAEVIGIASGKLPAGHFLLAIIRNNRGECLTTLGRFDEAEHELTESHAALEAHFKTGHARVEKSRARLDALEALRSRAPSP